MAFDSSQYRQNTYGAPTHYCDVTRSLASNGTGTLGDPWNLDQAKANAVAGDVVGIMRVGSGTPVQMAAPNDDNIPTFNPANSGTAGNPIVFTCQYAAVALDYSTITTNQDRSEFRHAGTADAADVAGTGGPTLGAYSRNYIIYDGFFIDMAQAHPTEDSAVIRVEGTIGIQFRNYVIKGETTDMDSNALVYTARGAIDTVNSNFRVRDFVNSPTGSGLNQPGAFTDDYGDENFIIEHFEIINCGKGIFMKSEHPTDPPPPTHQNYGVIRYGIVANGIGGMRFGSQHPDHIVDVHHVLIYGNSDAGVVWSSENAADHGRQNVHLDHVTIVGGAAGDNQQGAVYIKAETGQGNQMTNCIVDVTAGAGSNIVSEDTAASHPSEFTFNYNGYSRNNANPAFYLEGSYTTLASWRTASSGDANSVFYDRSSSDIFRDRASGDYRVALGHAALTADSTGGQLGCYQGGHVIGVDITSGSMAIFLR